MTPTSIVRSLLLLSCACAATGCGPIGATSVIGDAEIAVARAHTEGGDRYATYETTSADLYLQKAREEQGYAHYSAASDLAHKSVLLAEAATKKAAEGRKNPDTSPAPAVFESTKAVAPSELARPAAAAKPFAADAPKPPPAPDAAKAQTPSEAAKPTEAAPPQEAPPPPPRVVKPGDPVPQDPPPPPRAPQPKPEPIKAEPGPSDNKPDAGPADDQPRRVIKPGDAPPDAPARERKVPIEVIEPGDKR